MAPIEGCPPEIPQSCWPLAEPEEPLESRDPGTDTGGVCEPPPDVLESRSPPLETKSQPQAPLAAAFTAPPPRVKTFGEDVIEACEDQFRENDAYLKWQADRLTEGAPAPVRSAARALARGVGGVLFAPVGAGMLVAAAEGYTEDGVRSLISGQQSLFARDLLALGNYSLREDAAMTSRYIRENPEDFVGDLMAATATGYALGAAATTPARAAAIRPPPVARPTTAAPARPQVPAPAPATVVPTAPPRPAAGRSPAFARPTPTPRRGSVRPATEVSSFVPEASRLPRPEPHGAPVGVAVGASGGTARGSSGSTSGAGVVRATSDPVHKAPSPPRTTSGTRRIEPPEPEEAPPTTLRAGQAPALDETDAPPPALRGEALQKATREFSAGEPAGVEPAPITPRVAAPPRPASTPRVQPPEAPPPPVSEKIPSTKPASLQTTAWQQSDSVWLGNGRPELKASRKHNVVLSSEGKTARFVNRKDGKLVFETSAKETVTISEIELAHGGSLLEGDTIVVTTPKGPRLGKLTKASADPSGGRVAVEVKLAGEPQAASLPLDEVRLLRPYEVGDRVSYRGMSYEVTEAKLTARTLRDEQGNIVEVTLKGLREEPRLHRGLEIENQGIVIAVEGEPGNLVAVVANDRGVNLRIPESQISIRTDKHGLATAHWSRAEYHPPRAPPKKADEGLMERRLREEKPYLPE